jgi:hypothetical protein
MNWPARACDRALQQLREIWMHCDSRLIEALFPRNFEAAAGCNLFGAT